MKFDTLQRLFLARHPGGDIAAIDDGRHARPGVAVQFRRGGRTYVFRCPLYQIAERLELIPELDANALAADIVSALAAGRRVVADTWLFDTVRHEWRQAGHSGAVEAVPVGRRFDELLNQTVEQSEYRIITSVDNPWK